MDQQKANEQAGGGCRYRCQDAPPSVTAGREEDQSSAEGRMLLRCISDCSLWAGLTSVSTMLEWKFAFPLLMGRHLAETDGQVVHLAIQESVRQAFRLEQVSSIAERPMTDAERHQTAQSTVTFAPVEGGSTARRVLNSEDDCTESMACDAAYVREPTLLWACKCRDHLPNVQGICRQGAVKGFSE